MRKMNLARSIDMGSNFVTIPVSMHDYETGEELGRFQSISEAARTYGKSTSCISNNMLSLNKGGRKRSMIIRGRKCFFKIIKE